MDTLTQLRPVLTKLRMSGLLEQLDERIRQANENKLGYSEFLFSVMQDEIERRENHTLALRLRKSNLHPAKTMESFDLSANPKLPVQAIKELAGCSFVNKAENIIIVGPSGVGKTHLAQAFGHQACRYGHGVTSDRMSNILSYVHSGRADDSYNRKLRHLLEIPLLIIDDFGLGELSTREQMDFYEIVCGRYEKRSIIITSNRDLKEWFSLFQNALVASAIVDRLMHRGVRLVIEGDSYRFKDSVKLNAEYGLTASEN